MIASVTGVFSSGLFNLDCLELDAFHLVFRSLVVVTKSAIRCSRNRWNQKMQGAVGEITEEVVGPLIDDCRLFLRQIYTGVIFETLF